jgi:hypothetical protein
VTRPLAASATPAPGGDGTPDDFGPGGLIAGARQASYFHSALAIRSLWMHFDRASQEYAVLPVRCRQLLCFRLGLQLDVPIGKFDGEFDPFAVVLLADLFRLFVHERGKGIEVAGDALSRFFLGGDQSVI